MTKQTATVEWVSVAERMPEIPADAPEYAKSVTVLVTYDGYNRRVAEASWVQPTYTKRPMPPRWQSRHELWKFGTITHWAYMPAPAETP